MSGRYTEISIDEVISRVKMQLRLTNTTEWDDYFEVVIEEGLRSLRPLSMYKKNQCNIEVVNGKAKLPKGFCQLLGLRYNMPVVNGTNPATNCVTALYVDSKFLSNCGCTDIQDGPIFDYYNGFQIVKNYIVWNTNIDDTTMTLAYYGFNINEKGRLVIYEDYERALSAYACYQYALSWPDKYSQAVMDRYNQTWVNQRAKLRGEDVAFNFAIDKREVALTVRAMATSQFVNY